MGRLCFEVKNRPTDYSPTADQGAPKYWGYLPGHPDLYGYLDPLRFIRVNFELEQEISPLPLLNSLTRGVAVRNHPGESYASQESKTIWTFESWQASCATKRAVVNSEEWVFVNIPSRNQNSTVAAIHGPTGGWIKRSELVELPPSRAVIYRVKDALTSGLVIRDQTSLQANEVGRAFPGQCLVTISSQSATVNGEKWISFDLPELAMRNYPAAEPLASTTGWVRLTDLNNQADLQSIALEIVDSGSGIPEANSSISIDGLQVGITDRLGWIWVKVQELGGGLLKSLVSKADAATLELDPTVLIDNPTIEVKPTTTIVASSRFVVGDSVFIGNTGVGLRGRYPSPTSTTYNVLPDSAQGVIVGGPDNSDGYNRWRIRFNGFGYDMWCAEGEPGSSSYYLNKNRIGTAPTGPNNLSAMAASISQINLSWSDNSSNETGFQIERRLNASGSWAQIATRSAGVTTYSSTGLSAGTTYDFRVRAYNSAGSSGYTNTASAKTSSPAMATHSLTVNAVDISALQTLAAGMYSWEGTSTDFRSNTTSFTRTATVGKQITVSAPATLAGGRIFQYWLKDGSSREYNTAIVVTMDGPHVADAIYGSSPPAGRTLQSIAIQGPSSVDERSAASYSARATYTDGTTGTVSASWDESSSYSSISSNGMLDTSAVSSDKSVTITATATVSGVTKNASKSVTIRNTDTKPTYTLNLYAENGHISASPNLGSYEAGTEVRLSAHPDDGYIRTDWSGDADGDTQTIYITMNGNKSVTAHFVEDTRTGDLRVNILPPEAIAAGAQWKYRYYLEWRDSGNTQHSIPPGGGYVKFKDIPGWVTPDSFQTEVIGGQTVQFHGTYREILGTVQVGITPPEAVVAGAKWRINGGPWLESGTTLQDVQTGAGSIEFSVVSGWTTPVSQTITVERGGVASRTGNYGPPAGHPIINSVSPRTGPISGATEVTIDGVNFQPGASVTFGGTPAATVTVDSSSRIRAVTPGRSAYGTVALQLNSGGNIAALPNGFSYLEPLGSNIELVGQLGGSFLSIALQGNFAYVGEGSSLVIFDVANPSVPVERGRIVLPGLVNGIAVANGKAYVANATSGLYVVEISNPLAPSILGFYDTPGYAAGVAVEGAVAYVADEAAGLQILDVSQPTAPMSISAIDTPGSAMRVVVASIGARRVAAVADRAGGIRVVDVTAPTSPLELAELAAVDSPGARDVAIEGTLLYTMEPTRGVRIYEIANPTQPQYLGSYTSSNASALTVAGGIIYAAGSSLRIVNATNPSAPVLVKSFNLNNPATQARISGGNLFLPQASKGFKIVSVANPTSPTLQSTLRGIGEVEGVAIRGNLAITGNDGGGMDTVDISNPARPVALGHLEGDAVRRIAITGNSAVLANGGDLLRIADISQPDVPVLRSAYTAAISWDLDFLGARLVVAGSTVTDPQVPVLDLIDMANPASPQRVNQLQLSESAGNLPVVATHGNWAFATRSNTGLSVVDYTNVNAPVVTGFVQLGGYVYDSDISTAGNHVYVAEYEFGVRVVDVSVKTSPVIVATLIPTPSDLTRVNGVRVSGSRLLVTDTSMIYVYDISNPGAPVRLAHYDLPAVANDGSKIQMEGSLIYVATSEAGLTVLRLMDVEKPTVTITSPTTGTHLETTETAVTMSGSAFDNQEVTRMTWENDRGGGGLAVGTSNWSIGNIQLAAGLNRITVIAEDGEGNTGNDVIEVNSTAPDTSPPLVIITGPTPEPDVVTESESVALNGSASDNRAVSSVTWSSSGGIPGTALMIQNAWTTDALPLSLGPNAFVVTATDAAGNSSSDTITILRVLPDNSNPAITIGFPTTEAAYSTRENTINLSGVASDDGELTRVRWSNSLGVTGFAEGAAIWAVNGVILQPGVNFITITAEDASGKIGEDTISVTYTPYDADDDGIPDDWEKLHFSGLGTAGVQTDQGNTGISDFLKFALGMDPTEPDLSMLPSMALVSEASVNHATFKFRRLIAPGRLVYQIGVTDDFSAWDWTGDQIEQVGVPTPTGDGITEDVTVRLISPVGVLSDNKFLRLKVLEDP